MLYPVKSRKYKMSLTTFTSRTPQSLRALAKKLISPPKLGWLTTRFPKTINAMVTQKLINNTFAEQIADGDFCFLQDRLLQLEISDANLYVGISYRQSKIICTYFNDHPSQSDATLSINTADAIKLIQQKIDPDTLFFQRKLKINGDTELAHHVKNTIDTLDPEVIPSFIMKLLSEYELIVLRD